MSSFSNSASISRLTKCVLAMAAIGMICPIAHGAPSSWDGSISGNWAATSGADSNWTGGLGTNGQPATGDSLVFTSATGIGGTSLIDNLMTPGTFNVAGITFSAGSPAYTINPNTVGTNGFTLTAGITNSSTSLQTINDLIATTAARTITMTAGGGDVILGGNISGTGGGIATGGTGALTLSGANSYTGSTTVNANTLNIGSNTALGTGTLVVNNAGAVLDAVGGNRTLSNSVTLSNSFAFAGTNNLTLGAIPAYAGDRTIALNSSTGKSLSFGTLSNSSNAARTLTVNGAANNKLILGGLNLAPSTATAVRVFTIDGSGTVEVAGVVANGGSAFNHEMRYFGTGTLILSGANTYAGLTRAISGTLQLTGSLNPATYLRIGQSGAASGKFVLGGASGAVNQTVARFDNPQDHGVLNVLAGGANSISTFTVNNTTTDNFNGLVGGTGTNENNIGITKAGTGTLNLTAPNTYIGATTVQGGALNITGAQTGTGAVSITGGTLTVGGVGSINGTSGIAINGGDAKLLYTSSTAMTGTIPISLTQGTVDGSNALGALAVADNSANIVANGNGGNSVMTLTSLAFAGDATANVRTVAPAAGIVVTGALSTTGANGTVTINPTTTAWATGPNHLISYGSFSGSISDFTLGSIVGTLTSRQSFAGLVNTGTSIALQVNGDSPKWTGLDDANWAVGLSGTLKNWQLITAGTPTDYLEGDSVLFDDTAAGPTAVDIGSFVSPGVTTFNNSAKNYTLGSVGGFGIQSGSLSKTGTGSVTITNANSYNGGTTFSGGTLNVDNASALGSGAVSIAAGSAKTLNNTSGGAITLSTNVTQNWSDDFAFTGSNELNMGTGAVTISGGSRTVTVNASRLTVGGVNGSTTTALTVNGAGALAIGDSTVAGLSGNGNIENNAAANATLTVNQSTDTTYSGALNNGVGNALALTKLGTGKLTLSGASNYTGTTTLTAGTLVAAHPAAMGNTARINVAGSTGGGPTFIFATDSDTASPLGLGLSSNNAVTIVSDRATPGAAVNRTMTTPAGLGIGTINFASGANASGTGRITFTDTFRFSAGNAGTTLLNPTTGVDLTLPDVTKTSGALAQTLGLDGTSTGNEVAGVISNGTSTLSVVKSNTSTWALTGNNTYSGGTTITGGTLNVGNGGTTGSLGTGAVANSSTLNFNRSATFTVANPISGAGVINQNGAGTVVFTNTVANSVNVNSGGLDGTGSLGATTVADNAAIVLANGNGASGALTLSSLTFGGDATVNVRTSSPGLIVTGALTTTPANGTVTINPTTTTGFWANGPNNLISYGSLSGAIGNFTLGSPTGTLNPRQTYGGLVLNGNNLALQVNGDSPKWTGALSNVWSTATLAAPKNWKLITAGTTTDYLQTSVGDSVLFDDTATGTTTVDISSASVLPVSTTFRNSALNYTISSSGGFGITGVGSVTKYGSGTATITTNNSYSGATTVNSGTLTLAGANTSSAPTTVNPSGKLRLDFSAATAPTDNILGSSSPLVLGGGSLTVIGKASTNNTQTVASTTLNSGGSTITVTADPSSNPVVLNLGAITRPSSGTTAIFTLPTGFQDSTNGITTSSPTILGVLPSGIVSSPGTAANNSPDGFTIATVSGSNIVPYTGATGLTSGSGTVWGGIPGGGSGLINYDVAPTIAVGATSGSARSVNTIRYTGSGSFSQSGSTLTINGFMNAGGGAVTIGQSVIVGAGLDLVLAASSHNINVTGAISNNGTNASALTTTGPNGIVNLSAVNTYTGPTSVTGGTLQISGAGSIESSSAITINGANAKLLYTSSTSSSRPITLTQGTLDGVTTVGAVTVGDGTGGIVANGNGTATPLTLSSLTYAGEGKMSVTVDGSTPTIAGLTIGALTANGSAASVVVDATPQGAWQSNTTYTLASYTGGSIGGTGLSAFTKGTILGLSTRTPATLGSSGTALTLSIGTTVPIVWTGLDNANWATGLNGALKNWKIQSNNSPTDFLNLDEVVFDDAGTNTTVNISGPAVNVARATFSNTTAKSYTLTGSGIASGSLQKDNTGSLTINTANTYDFGTTFNGGTLNIGNAAALGTGTLTIGAGSAKTLDNTSGGPLAMSGDIAQNWNADFTFAGTNDLNMGAGAVTLSTSSVAVSLQNAGTLSVGGLTGTSTILSVNGSGTGALAIATSTIGGLSGNGIIENNAAAAATLTVDQSTDTTFNGVLRNSTVANTLTLSKTNSGILTLTSANPYTGNTNITNGTLTVKNANAVGTGVITFSGSSNGTLDLALDPGSDLANQFIMNTGGNATIRSGRLTPGAGTTHSLTNNAVGGGTLTIAKGSNVTSGTPIVAFTQINMTAGTDGANTVFNPTDANVTLDKVVTGGSARPRTLTLDGTGNGSVINGIDGAIGILTVIKSNSSTWTIGSGGNSSYTGNTTVSGGTLLVNNTTSTNAVSVTSGGTLGGTGTIDTSLTSGNVTVAAGGSLAPGASAGTLTFNTGGGSLDLSAVTAGGLKFELGAPATPGASDQITLTSGNLNIGTLDFSDFAFTNLGGVALGTYKLFDAASSITGSIGTASGSFGGFNATLSMENTTDFDVLLTVTGVAALPGDYNNDGRVNSADYVLWRKTPSAFGGTPAGYNTWRANFGVPPGPGAGSSLPGTSGAVPEPGTCLLFCLGSIALLATRRVRRG